MAVQKLSSTDAFVVVDLEGADRAVGVARLAKKVLVDGAELLARATTYSFATFGVRACGASAGINAAPEDRDAAVAAFVHDLAGRSDLHLTASTGLTVEDLAALGDEPLDDGLTALGAVAATTAFAGGSLSGKRAVIAGGGWLDRLTPWWEGAGGGSIDEAALDTDADVLFLAGKAGMVDHEAADTVRAGLVVPLTPVPITAKAYAVLVRSGRVFVPDAVSCAAPLLAIADAGGGDPVERVAVAAAELASEGPHAWRSMVERAEVFLSSWQGTLPFGRPLA